MLEKVNIKAKQLEAYRPIVGDEVIEEIVGLARMLKGARVLHINATTFGGGVAEILHTFVPLMQDVGLQAEWQVIRGEDEFFNITKMLHNGLQGAEVRLSEAMRQVYSRVNRQNAQELEGEYDFIVVHDPQPAAIRHFHSREGGKFWIWRSHIDTSSPNPEVWDFLHPFLQDYDAGIFTLEQYVYGDLKFPYLAIIPPSIDPLSEKNAPQALEEGQGILRKYGLDLERPLITQVSRFDPWKDPLGVIDAYRLVKSEIPEVQLALVGSMASDDPEGWDYYDRTVRHAGDDFDIHILHNFHGVGPVEVNAFQRLSDVVIQKSTREGFGLVVSEALWKERPVVGGKVGGIPIQVVDGETGYLVDDVPSCAERTLYLLQNPDEGKVMGIRGRERVRKHFLVTRHLKDYLTLFNDLIK